MSVVVPDRVDGFRKELCGNRLSGKDHGIFAPPDFAFEQAWVTGLV